MPKKQHDLSDEDQEPEDIRAWGNRRENYYQQGEDDYSSSAEEQNEAEELYQRQLKDLGHQDVYELPQEDADNWQEDQDDEDNDQAGAENTLSHAYLTKEIAKTAKMGLKLS